MQEIDKVANPFPGLRPFESTETHLFFGRDGQSEELLRRLKRTRFLAVVGTSGSGKSSLVRAGLLPALQGGLMASAGSDWRIAILRPGGDPIGNLARALSSPAVLGSHAEKGTDMQAVLAETALRRSGLGLVELVSRARSKVDENGKQLFPGYENLLVVVDQFEELFRFKQLIEEENSKEDAAAFVKLLLEAVGQKAEKIYVVLTMRSDFLGDCSQFWELPEAINNGQYLIPRMTRDERREAISGPVAVGAGTISEPLVNQLLNDVGDNPDQLPILQHALMRTWDYWLTHRRNGNPIDISDYHAIGGMAEALSLHADEAYAELNDAQKRIAEKLFKGLTEKGTDNREIRRPMEVGEICELTGAGEAAVIAVIEVFRREGRSFLMPPPTDALTGEPVHLNRESLIDISHESLIRNWERLKIWVDEESQSARIYKRLAQTAMLHQAGEEALLIDPALQGALDWREKNKPNAVWARRYHPDFETAMTFLDASAAAREAELKERERRRKREASYKRSKWVLVVLGLAFTLSLGALTYANSRLTRAKAALSEANKRNHDAEELLSQVKAKAVAAQDKADAAEQESVTAKEETGRAKDAQQAALKEKHEAELAKAQAVQQKDIATRARAEAIVQKDAAIAERRQSLNLLYASDINLAQQAFETDYVERARDLLAEHKPDAQNAPGFEWQYLNRQLHLELETSLKAPALGPTTIMTSPDGRTIVLAAGRTVELRNLETDSASSAIIDIPDDKFSIGSVAISRDGKLLAVGNRPTKETEETTIINLYEVPSGKEINSLKGSQGSDSPTSIGFTADDKKLVLGGSNGQVQLWDRRSQQKTDVIKLAGPVTVAISPLGQQLALSSADSEHVVLWDLSTNSEAGRLPHDTAITSLAFTPDGKRLVSGGDKTTVWDLKTLKRSSDVPFGSSKVLSLAISPDSRVVAIGRDDGQIKFCDVSYLGIVGCETLKGHREDVTSLAFSADGKLLFSSDVASDGQYAATIRSWDFAQLRRDQTTFLVGPGVAFQPLTYSSDSKTLAFVGYTNRVMRLDAETNAVRKDAAAFPTISGTIAFSPVGDLVARIDSEKGVVLSSLETGTQIGKPMEHGGESLMAMAFSPDGKLLTTVTKPGAVRVWDTASQELLSKPPNETRNEDGLSSKTAFSPDGRLLVLFNAPISRLITPRSVAVEFWTRTQALPSRRFEIPEAEQGGVLSAAFSHDGKVLAIAYDNGNVVLHDTENFDVRATLKAGLIYALAFSPDGRTLATGGVKGSLKLWGVASQRELLNLTGLSSKIVSITFSPDGKKLAAAGGRAMKIWRASTDESSSVEPQPTGRASLFPAPAHRLPAALASLLFPGHLANRTNVLCWINETCGYVETW